MSQLIGSNFSTFLHSFLLSQICTGIDTKCQKSPRVLNLNFLDGITFQVAGRQGTGKSPGVIGYGQQQRCGRDVKRLRFGQKMFLHRITVSSPPKSRRIEETVVVLRHFMTRRSAIESLSNWTSRNCLWRERLARRQIAFLNTFVLSQCTLTVQSHFHYSRHSHR